MTASGEGVVTVLSGGGGCGDGESHGCRGGDWKGENYVRLNSLVRNKIVE